MIYYRILKGSGSYDLATHQGYPPLSDFFSLETKERNSVYFSFASLPVLSALFGKQTAEEIMQKEEEKSIEAQTRKTLSKQEVEEFLLKKKWRKK